MKDKWIKVSDKLPPTSSMGFSDIYWVYDLEYGVATASYSTHGGGHWTGDDDQYMPTDYYNVTHWQPIETPAPPRVEIIEGKAT